MSKVTKKELAKRKNEMTQRARADVAKTEIMQFRLDTDTIQKLYEHADKAKMPVGTMVRQWVMDRLTIEENGGQNDIASLHARFDRFEEILMNKK